jgi:acetyl-CoA carboxylase biotin carboxyl carrier protein
MPATKFDEEFIHRLAKVLQDTGLSEIEIENEGSRIRVARQIQISAMTPMPMVGGAAMMPQPANTPAPAIAAANPADHPGCVKSPMVGTAYGAPEPGKPAFVKIGDKVNKGQTLLIIEAMKVMNPIPAPNAGTVKEIVFKDGAAIEFGEPLVVIE